MSRRARSRMDKREEALRLARFMGHGDEMPDSDHQADDEDQFEPDHRIPIGPLDVQPQNSERHA